MLILHDPTSAKRWACVVEGGFPLGVFQANLLGLPVTRARVHHSAPGSRTRERPRHPSVEDLGPL